MSPTRQLTAIMFADIVGYSALMQEDETLALQHRQKMTYKLEEEVKKHGGRVLELRGDGALCSFTSTLQSVKAALALQLDMQIEPLVPLRIGMHTGDVILDGNSVYGDGVNIASRLESFAVPGSIIISGKVYDDIKNQKEIQTVSLGKYALKNITEQVEIFAISHPGITTPDPGSSLLGKGEKVKSTSVLVLPFINMSNDPEQEYFNDGLTEELISNLSRLTAIRVISRTTSMLYKATSKDIKTIASETGANFIMEGSVRKQGNNLRITAQFVEPVQDVHLWAENYRGTVDDIFDIQEKVSIKIVEALQTHLTKEDRNKLKKRYTDDSTAYQFYLQGRFLWKQRNSESLTSAAKYFEKALQKDPDYALAWTGLADTYSLQGEYTTASRHELFPKQMEAVNRALEIDNQLGEAHISLAIAVMLNDWDWRRAEREFKLGIELSPNYATGHHWYSEWFLFNGRFNEALEEILIAIELDPVSQAILKDKGIHYYYTRQFDKAVDAALSTLDLDPNFIAAHRLLSISYLAMGKFAEAIEANERWGTGTGDKVKTDIALAHIYATAGREEEAGKIMENTVGENLLGSNDYRGVGLVYAALGENDHAFHWLEKSFARHEESLCTIKIDPKMDPLRSDPRLEELIRKIGL